MAYPVAISTAGAWRRESVREQGRERETVSARGGKVVSGNRKMHTLQRLEQQIKG